MNLFERLKAYVGFGDEEARLVADLTEVVDRHGNEIIGRFYARILETPETRAVIRDARQLARLKETFRIWLGQLVLGPYDDRYYEMRCRIGRRHVEVGLPAEYMFAAMNVMRTVVTEIVVQEHGQDAPRLAELLIALGKILDLELAVMVSTYQEDLIEKWRQRDREAAAERIASLEATAAGLAHEIGNPLNAVAIHLELLKRRIARVEAPGVDLLEPVSTIGESFRRIQNLVREFQDYSRGPQLALRRVDLAEAVRRLVDEQSPLAAERRVEIEAEIVAAPVVLADADKIHQVFVNLLTNACEAMPEGGRVRIRVVQEALEGVATFRDDGPGIPVEEQQKIFGMYYSTKERKSGLGLAISERIVLAHGGRLTLESRPGQGAAFAVRLPVA